MTLIPNTDRRYALASRSAAQAPGSDKLVHLNAFAALAFPLASIGLLPVFIGAAAFGVIDLLQPSFNRVAKVND